jgi:hypothetical protein
MVMKNKNKKIGQSKQVDHSKFTGKDGYLVGGVDIEMSKPAITRGQCTRCRGHGRPSAAAGEAGEAFFPLHFGADRG